MCLSGCKAKQIDVTEKGNAYCFLLVISCGHPGHTKNSSLVGNRTLFGDTIQYVCHDGFEIEGEVNVTSRVITCLAEGSWNVSRPKCTRKFFPNIHNCIL